MTNEENMQSMPDLPDENQPAQVAGAHEHVTDDAQQTDATAAEATQPSQQAVPDTKEWYVLKVQSNREDSIRDAILKRIKIAGLESFIGDVVVPTEKVSEIKAGKKKVTERKLYPGYIMIQLEINEEVWFTIRETPGVGDFVGAAGKPSPMAAHDVDRMLGRKQEVEQTGPRLKIRFQKGDRIKIKEGPFENFEGNVDEIIESKGLVRVMIQVFGRPAPVELEYWQVEAV